MLEQISFQKIMLSSEFDFAEESINQIGLYLVKTVISWGIKFGIFEDVESNLLTEVPIAFQTWMSFKGSIFQFGYLLILYNSENLHCINF